MNDNRIWDEDSLLNIVGLGENEHYEFKGSKEIDLSKGIQNINRGGGLSKSLSAFANSGGGTLIIGINDKTSQVDDGGVCTKVKPNGTKAWLEDILPPLVDPPLTKLNVVEVSGKNNDSKISQGHAVYIIEVEDSPLAPHQSVVDNVYYGRVAGKSRPLSHRMVLDIINRRQYPNIEISFNIGYVNENDPNLILFDGQHPILLVKCLNTGTVFAKYVNVILHIPKYLLEQNSIRTLLKGTFEILDGGNHYVRIVKENIASESYSMEGHIVGRSPGRYVPILPGQEHETPIPLCEKFQEKEIDFLHQGLSLQWEVYADNAPCKRGEILIQGIKKIKPTQDKYYAY